MCQKSPKKYIVIANQCRNTDVALSKDSLRSQSPDFSENYRQGAKAPLADQGWCSAQRIKIEMIASGNHTIICAAPVRTLGLRGSELPAFCVLSLTQFDNPSVKNQRFLPAVHCGMTATGSHGNFDSLRGAPLSQGKAWGTDCHTSVATLVRNDMCLSKPPLGNHRIFRLYF